MDIEELMFFKKQTAEYDISTIQDNEGHSVHLCMQTGRWICAENLSNEEEKYLHEGFPPLTLAQYRSMPTQLIVNVTNRCNLNCVYCYAPKCPAMDIEEQVFSDSLTFLGKFASGQNCNVLLTGGEAMLVWPQIYEWLLKYRKNWVSNLSFSIQSNGTLINEENAAQLRKERFNVGISLDGPQWIHDKNRSNSYQKVIKAIEILMANKIQPGIRMTVTAENAEYIPEALRDLLTLGIRHFTIGFTDPLGSAQGTLSLLPTPEQRADLMKKELEFCVEEFQKGNKIQILGISQILVNLLTNIRPACCPNTPCGAGISLLGVDVEGNVYPCDYLFEENMILGKVTEFNKVVKNLRQSKILNHIQNSHLHECEKCPAFQVCRGGCRISRYVYDRLQIPFPNCSYMKEITAYFAWKITTDKAVRDYAIDIVAGDTNFSRFGLHAIQGTIKD